MLGQARRTEPGKSVGGTGWFMTPDCSARIVIPRQVPIRKQARNTSEPSDR